MELLHNCDSCKLEGVCCCLFTGAAGVENFDDPLSCRHIPMESSCLTSLVELPDPIIHSIQFNLRYKFIDFYASIDLWHAVARSASLSVRINLNFACAWLRSVQCELIYDGKGFLLLLHWVGGRKSSAMWVWPGLVEIEHQVAACCCDSRIIAEV